MLRHKNIVILINDKNNLPELYSFKTMLNSDAHIHEIVMDSNAIELVNIELKNNRSKNITKQELMSWHFRSERQINFDTNGIYSTEQVHEEIIVKGDLLLLYCAYKDIATAFTVEKIRKGIFSLIRGKYKIQDLKGVTMNTNNLREEKGEKISFRVQPTTRLFRLKKRKVNVNNKFIGLKKHQVSYTFSS